MCRSKPESCGSLTMGVVAMLDLLKAFHFLSGHRVRRVTWQPCDVSETLTRLGDQQRIPSYTRCPNQDRRLWAVQLGLVHQVSEGVFEGFPIRLVHVRKVSCARL